MVVAALVACSDPATSASSPSPSSPAQSQAGNLRVRLDLLLGEHVMIVAKESEAAVNHGNDYSAYAALLATNSSDLESVLGRAFGNTTAGQIAKAWNAQNGYLVDYAIGVVTHDDGKASAARLALTDDFVPQFAQLLGDASGAPTDKVKQLANEQAQQDRRLIDDIFVAHFEDFYTHLHAAYAHTAMLGDLLAIQVATRFPDKFPGNPELRAVEVRASASELLQERSYIATMGTAAHIAGRTAESSAASSALKANSQAIADVFAVTLGMQPADLFVELEPQQNQLLGYADGSAGLKSVVTQNAESFASLAHVPKAYVRDHASALLKVIDDQRAKSSTNVAGDDRAAATSTQPIADSIQG
jgi:hypothetical protein